jgi:myo-inositol-1(or 4)-monophosphatase
MVVESCVKADSLQKALGAAEAAARGAGVLMRRNLNAVKRVNSSTQHDIKLALDVECQRRIERGLSRALPEAAILGEEGTSGDQDAPLRWVVDPIDGTVNFTYGIPHACVSIALQERRTAGGSPTDGPYADGYATVAAVVHDPFTSETWTALEGRAARLNGRPIRVTDRAKLSEAIIALGFAKRTASLKRMLPVFERLVPRVRKIRIMGAAALSMTYVASGRFDAYVESGVRLWDIAAGGFLVQQAGGVFWRRALDAHHTYAILVSAPALQRPLRKLAIESCP